MKLQQILLLVFLYELLHYFLQELIQVFAQNVSSKDSYKSSFRDFYGPPEESFQKIRLRQLWNLLRITTEVTSKVSLVIPPKILSDYFQKNLHSARNVSNDSTILFSRTSCKILVKNICLNSTSISSRHFLRFPQSCHSIFFKIRSGIFPWNIWEISQIFIFRLFFQGYLQENDMDFFQKSMKTVKWFAINF